MDSDDMTMSEISDQQKDPEMEQTAAAETPKSEGARKKTNSLHY